MKQNQSSPYILGLWDGHDAGAALIRGDQVLFCMNEERLSRKKLHVGFPVESIRSVLNSQGLLPGDISEIAFTTSDFSKTLTRVFPSMKDAYYLIRRRKVVPGFFYGIKKTAKYILTLFPSSSLWRVISRKIVSSQLKKMGFKKFNLTLVGHHEAHAACAAFNSGFAEALVITLDGIGDGLSGSSWVWKDRQLKKHRTTPGRDSFGIFFEHVTNLMNMRELEDEGKVMALANYAFPVPDEKNPMLDLFRIDHLGVHCKYGPIQLYRELQKIQWAFPHEQFAYMAQRVLEIKVLEHVKLMIEETGLNQIAYSGGVASNIKINRLIRELPGVNALYVFPHMGDGGQALGAAQIANESIAGVNQYRLSDLYLGPEFSDSDISAALESYKKIATKIEDPATLAANLISQGEIIFWFQGRMEYGPRSLGARSILALPNSIEIKDALNLSLKRRVWYQPFCPSMLESDAKKVLENSHSEINPFMTRAYLVKEEHRESLQGVIGVDGTCRPQILKGDEGTPFVRLLNKLKEKTGNGIVLNTSFNIHGEPLVCSPMDALKAFQDTGVSHLIMGHYYVKK